MAQDQSFQERWKKLYHLEIHSDANFYFTPTPQEFEKEILKAQELFNSSENLNTDLHFQCRFPARFKLLKENSSFSYPISECPSFDKWMKELSPEGISLIFAGNYPDNPGSIFGHTFLKVRTAPHSRFQANGDRHSEILDYAINYAANVDDEIGVLYAFKGVLGGYQGYFSMDPYYVKVNEYSEGEGRDIWEYELAISPEEAKFLMAHYWEMRYQASFSYYFLDDNCSYLVLSLLDSTRPDWKINQTDPPYVVPLETVKQVMSIPGAVKNVNYRPSIRKRAEKAYDRLDSSQKSEVINLLNQKREPEKSFDPHVLNTVALNNFSLKSQNDGKLAPADEELLDKTLLRLSKLDTSLVNNSVKRPGHPFESHDVKQLGFALGNDDTTYLQFHFRIGLHDMTDFSRGYLDYSELVLLDFKARWQEERLSLYHVELFDLGVLRPTTLRDKSYSWRTRWSYQNESQVFCKRCRSFYGEAGIGYAYHLYPKLLTYIMAGGFLNPESLESKGLKTGGFAEWGAISNLTEDSRLLLAMTSYLNVMNTLDGRNLNKLMLQVTHNFNKDTEINLISHSGLFVSGSESYEADLQISMDYHF